MGPVAIYGAGGSARETAWLLEDIARHGALQTHVACFIDDDPARSGERVNGIEVMTLEQLARKHPDARYVVAVGDGLAREALSRRAESRGLEPISAAVHPSVQRSRLIDIGVGSTVCAGSVLTTNLRIGRHVQINIGCMLSHDAIVEDFVTLSPGARIAGWVHIEPGALIGVGATVINGSPHRRLVIGTNAVIGAGATVISDVAPGTTVAGVPARPLARDGQ